MKKLIYYIGKVFFFIIYIITFPFFLLVAGAMKWEDHHYIAVTFSGLLPILLVWTFIGQKYHKEKLSTFIIALIFYSLAYSIVVSIVTITEQYILTLIMTVFGLFYDIHVKSEEKFESIVFNSQNQQCSNHNSSQRKFTYGPDQFINKKKTIKDSFLDKIDEIRYNFSEKMNLKNKNSQSNNDDEFTYQRYYRNAYSYNQKRRSRSEQNNQSKQQYKSNKESSNTQSSSNRKADAYHDALTLFMIEEPFTLEELKSRRNILIKTFHPDNSSKTNTEAEKINNAFDILKKHVAK